MCREGNLCDPATTTGLQKHTTRPNLDNEKWKQTCNDYPSARCLNCRELVTAVFFIQSSKEFGMADVLCG